MAGHVEILGIPGSLRAESFNHTLLEAARDLADDGISIEIFDIGQIPHYDADVEAWGDPGEVKALKRKITEADGLLIATPEYQHGVPGVLKNALDWASRLPDNPPLHNKPTAIMGATVGNYGTARAQEQLRSTLMYNDCPMVTSPEVLVSDVQDKVDDAGRLVDEQTLGFIGELLDSLRELIEDTREPAPT